MSAERAPGADWFADAARRLLEEAGHAPECRACPVCQAVAMIRRNGPELLDGISALAAGLAASLRAARDEEPEQPVELREAAPPPPVVLRTERIDVTD